MNRLFILLFLLATAILKPAHGALPVSGPDAPSSTGAGSSHLPAFSADGLHVAFLSQANNLVTNDDLGQSLDLFVRDLVSSNLVLVSVSSSGFGGANRDVGTFALASNAQVIAFESAASNLVPGDDNFVGDIFVRDPIAGTTRLVSVSLDSVTSGNGPSFNPLISADGRYVIFESLASNLVTNDFNGTNDVFLRDLVANTTTLVSVNRDGNAGADGSSGSPGISADGRFVTFVSTATNIVSGVTNRLGEVYVRDTAGGTTLWAVASQLTATREAPPMSRYAASGPVLSADGKFVVFKTLGGAVVRFDTSRPTNQVFQSFPPLANGSISTNFFFGFVDNPRLVKAPEGGASAEPVSVSRDGRFVAFGTAPDPVSGNGSWTVRRVDFEGLTTNLTVSPPEGGTPDQVWIHMTNAVPTLTLVSTNFGSNQPSTPRSLAPVMSADSALFAFVSDAANAPGMSTGLYFRIYLRDLGSNTVESITTNRMGSVGNVDGDSLPALSPDGTRLAWESTDENLVPDDFNDASDVFVRNIATGETVLISARHPLRPAVTARADATATFGSLNAAGSRVAFLSADFHLSSNDTNRAKDAFLKDLRTGTLQTISALPFPVSNPDPFSLLQYFPTNQAVTVQLDAAGQRVLLGTGFLGSPSAAPSLVHLWRDLLSGTNLLVTTLADSAKVSLSAGGRFVLFPSAASAASLGAIGSDNNNSDDVFIWNSAPGFQEGGRRVSILSARQNSAGNAASINPVFSPDGCWVAFLTAATDLTSDSFGSTNFQLLARDQFCHPTNYLGGTNRLISYRTAASLAANGRSVDLPWRGGATNPVFSADNHYVFFQDGISNTIYRHDLIKEFVVTISLSNTTFRTNIARVTNETVCVDCRNASVNVDGRYLAFETAGVPGVTNIILKDLLTGATQAVSLNIAGTAPGNGPSWAPLLTWDARYVIFTSKASNLTAGDTNQATDIFARDLRDGVTFCLSQNQFGTGTGNHVSSRPVLSADGRTVAFQSFANDLVPGDYNDARDVFVVSLAGPDTDGDGLDDDWEVAFFTDLSRDGAGDFDGDGASDAEEFRAGTDPTNGGSIFRVITLSTAVGPQPVAPRSTTILWASTPFKTYRVQFKDGDLSGPWQDLPGDILATGATAAKVHATIAGGPSRAFYRVCIVD